MDHFFYSEKQYNSIHDTNFKSISRPSRTFCKLNTGEIVEYTEQSVLSTPSGIFDDYKFLGIGEYHHSIPE